MRIICVNIETTAVKNWLSCLDALTKHMMGTHSSAVRYELCCYRHTQLLMVEGGGGDILRPLK